MKVYDVETRKMWRKKRREKEIMLTEISALAGCAHNHFSQWEMKEDYPVSEDKLKIYFEYIESK